MADNRRFLDQAGLQLLVEKLTGKYDARYIAAADFGAAKVGYENDEHMSGVENVKQALDVLAANVVRQEGKLALGDANMQEVEGKIDDLQAQVGVEAEGEASATGLFFRIGVLEELMGQNEEGATGSFATRVADLESEVDVLQDAIEDINDAENGILAQAKSYADQQDTADKTVQAAVDQEQDRRIKALEDDAPAKQAAIEAAQADADALEKRLDDEGGLVDRLEAAEAAIDDINDNANGILAQAKAYADNNKVAKADFETFQEENTQAIADALQAAKDYADDEDDKIEAKLAGLKKDTVQAAIDDAEAAAKADAAAALKAAEDAQDTIDAFLKDADVTESAVDTLKEIQTYIESDGEAAEQLVARVAANEGKLAGLEKNTVQAAIDQAQADAEAKAAELDAALHTTISTEIDVDVKAEADRAKAEEARIEGLVTTEKSRAEGQEAAIREEFAAADTALENRVNQKIADDIAAAIAQEVSDRDDAIKVEADRAKGVEQGLQAAIDALEAANAEGGAVAEAIDAVDGKADAAQAAADAAQDDVDALKVKVGTIADGETVAGLIADNAAAAQAAQDAADTAQGEIDALELVVGEAAAGDEPATGLFAAIAAVQADVDQNESDCDAAIKAEEEARKTADQGLDTRVKVFEAGGARDVAALAGRVSTLEAITVMSESEIDQVIEAVFPEQA